MRFDPPLLGARLIRRHSRFLAEVCHEDGKIETVHCPNSGSMRGLVEPGRRVLLSLAPNPETRRLPRTLEAIRVGRTWVGTHTHRANAVVSGALSAGLLPELRRYRQVQPEIRVSTQSRIDFRLSGSPDEPDCYLEVKSATQRVGDGALFPDSVTERGRRHLEELMTLVRQGHRAAVLFLVMRADCGFVGPAEAVDPGYAEALRRAAGLGVLVLGYRTRVSRAGLQFAGALPVDLHPS